jgi:hypothetical protein
VFTKGTNDWNRYTVLELLAVAYANPGSDPAKSLPFPDLSRVAIKRLGLKGEADSMFFVDVAALLNSGDCTNAPWLEWGDLVDLPEQDHPVNERWLGLPLAARKALTECLRRSVEIVVKGESRMVMLTPSFQVLNVVGYGGQELVVPDPVVVHPGPQPRTGAISLSVFRLNDVLRGSGLLRVSSDLSRVRVKRTDPITRKPVEWIVNLSPESPGETPSTVPGIVPGSGRRMRPVSDSGSDSATDLWLRDGDVIEVPEK